MCVLCLNTLIFPPECWKCILCIQIFPETRARKSRLCHEFVSFFTYSKAFAIYLKSYEKPWSYQTFFIFLSAEKTDQLHFEGFNLF